MEVGTDFYQTCYGEGNIEESEMLKCITDSQSLSHENLVYGVNVLFTVYAASLVFFMQAGFAMLCSGNVRKKNVQNTLLKNLLDACGSALSFFSVGYAFAYGGNDTGKTFIGSEYFFLMGLQEEGLYSDWLFQFAFAATAGTIVAGTMAERCQMNAYFLYSIILCGFVYPVVAHSIWSENGFLSYKAQDPLWGVGMIDFAGSGVVHVTGGVTATIATVLLGPRKGRFYDEAKEKLEDPKPFPGHSKSLQILGTFILWFGWYGFNAGSALNAGGPLKPALVANAAVNTTLSAAAGGISALITNLIITERLTGEAMYNLTYAMNGCLSGLVAITGSCAFVEPWAAVVIGMVAGWVYLAASKLLIKLCLDDAVDAIPVHLFNGMWGVIAVGLFSNHRGLMNLTGHDEIDHIGWFYSWGKGTGDFTLMGCQLVGLLFIVGWVSAIMLPFFVLLNYLGLLRADGLEEIVGLDISYHGSNSELNIIDQDASQQWLDLYNERRAANRRNGSKHARDESETDDGKGVDRFG